MICLNISAVGLLQEIDELVSRAKEVQQQVWSPSDDVTVVDDGPVEIRQLLMPCVSLCLFTIIIQCYRFCVHC